MIIVDARVPQDLVTTGGKCMILKWVTGWFFPYLASLDLWSLLPPFGYSCLHL